MNKNILALDLATEFGVYDGYSPPEAIRFGCKETRILDFFMWLDERLLDGNYHTAVAHYDVVAIENAINQKAFANEAFHELKAVTKLLCTKYGIEFAEIAPSRVKKLFTGDGKATKEDIIEKCLEMGVSIPYRTLKSGKNKGQIRYNDNAADAVAVYHAYIRNEMETSND